MTSLSRMTMTMTNDMLFDRAHSVQYFALFDDNRTVIYEVVADNVKTMTKCDVS